VASMGGTCPPRPCSTRRKRRRRLLMTMLPNATARSGIRPIAGEGWRYVGRAVRQCWLIIKDTGYGFVADEALSRGAAIAFYTATSLAPVLLIVIAIAGLVFGHDAAQNAITGQLSGLMGDQTAQLLQTAVASASKKSSGTLATLVGLLTLILTASGVFGEMQSALNAIWKAEPSGTAITRLIRARAVSLGLVAALGFLLLVSLVVSATLAAFGNQLNAILPFGKIILSLTNLIVSFALITVLFAAIYKILPDRPLAWRDVILGAVVTAALFTAGKSLIALYIGRSDTVSSYGAAGALIAVLLWVYYSAQIFLLGAEFTKAYASYRTRKPSLTTSFAGRPAEAKMSNVYIEARPKGPPEGTLIIDYAIEDQADHLLGSCRTQEEALDWARSRGLSPLVPMVRHLNDKKKPAHWRPA
jgi:membrane protein